MVALEQPVGVLGSQSPRIELIPDGDEHPRWPEMLAFLERVDLKLDPWQERILWASLLRVSDGWAARRIGVCCPRQNGKNVILAARQLIGAYLLNEKMVIHSAHLADTSMEHFRFLDNLIDASEWLHPDIRHIRRQNGHEQITFSNRSRIRFRTRTSGGGRGFSGSPLAFDEAMYLSTISYAAMRPMISAQPDPQVWLTGSAVDQTTMPDGLVFARLRENALAGVTDEDGSIAYFEWSLDYPTPADVPPDVMMTEEAMAQVNPAYGRRITRQTIIEEIQDFPSDRMSAVERFGVGDWPKADGTPSVIDLALWAKLTDPRSKAVDPVVFAFDVREDRGKSVIAAVCRRRDGPLHLEVFDQRDGTGWLVERLGELDRKHRPLAIVLDGFGPAASLIPELEQARVVVQALTTPEVAKACGMFFDAVQQAQLRHLGSAELLAAIKGAAQRPIGDAWTWSRKNSAADISPLVACTLGVWAVVSAERKPGAWMSGG